MRRSISILLAGTLVFVVGCSDLGGMATRYRVERMFWQAQREEARLRLDKARPDSTTLLKIHDAYARLRATFRPPFVKGTGDTSTRLRAEIARQVGMAELTSARFALQARRPDVAQEQAKWVASVAEADTGLHREADFMLVSTLQAQRKPDEAIAVMYGMLDRYRPIPPSGYGSEDRILSVPDGIIAIREAMGDSAGVRRERARVIAYYRGVLGSSPPPLLQAQVGGRLARMLIEAGRPAEAFAEVAALRRLASATPALGMLQPDLIYTEARIREMVGDEQAALELFDLVLMTYPDSRYASNSLLDSGALLERKGNRKEALDRYRAIYDRPNVDPDAGSIAAFRAAMVNDQMGKWVEAKQILERIPIQYPRSRAAVEAPFAIAEHYIRAREGEATKAALLRAVDAYRGMIAQDTASVYATACRWNIVRAYAGLQRWNDALTAIDQMAILDRGLPVTAQALVEGARISYTLGNRARSDAYLRRLTLEYPGTPVAEAARQILKSREAESGGKRNAPK